jgi:hypothetical protein
MTSPSPSGVRIDRLHTGAICEEIGERLRNSPTGNSTGLPPSIASLTELLGLLERFEGVECDNVPSTVPIGSAPR